MEPPSSYQFLTFSLHSEGWIFFVVFALLAFLCFFSVASGVLFSLVLKKNTKWNHKAQLYVISNIVLLFCLLGISNYLLTSFCDNLGYAAIIGIEFGILSLLILLILFLMRYGAINPKTIKLAYPKKEDIDELDDDETPAAETFKALQNTEDIEVKEILSSRMDITAIDISMDFNTLYNIVIESGYSRLPVYEEDFDHVKGILYVKDLLPYIRNVDNNFKWQDLLHEAFFISEHKKINILLDEMKRKKIHMAIVVDEYGGTTGIVTLEDILEELVGEIFDESDTESDESLYVKLKDNSYSFEGKTPLVDFCRIMKIDHEIFDNIKGDAETLAGLLLELKGEFPQKGEEINAANLKFKVESVDERRIRRIRVTKDEM